MIAALIVLAAGFAVACALIPSWRPYLEVVSEDRVRVFGSKRAHAIRTAQGRTLAAHQHDA